MLPIYKCSSCGSVFVEWTVGEEHGTPWYFIQQALNGNRPTTIRASLICPKCRTDNGTVVWTSGGPLTLLNFNVTATILSVTNLTTEDAQVTEKVIARAKEMYPNEVIVSFKGVEMTEDE
jgi:hypothetical protein